MIDIPLSADLVRGALELEHTGRGLLPHRLPAWARTQANDPQFAMVEAQPAGVRVVFRTAATTVELDAVPTRQAYVGLARPDGVHDLVVDGVLHQQLTADGGDRILVDLASGTTTVESGPTATLRFGDLPVGEKTIEIWLPHNERTELVALRTNARVVGVPTDERPVWLHHGSSISHGSNAASPTGTWPVVAARRAGVDLVNLGFGGSALLDPFLARVLRDTPADMISLKLGINLVNADLLRRRAFGPAVHGFLDTIRDGHPDTPLLVVSPILCPIHENTPGPGSFDTEALQRGEVAFVATGDPAEAVATATGKLTLQVIREELDRIVTERAASDPALFVLDGRELYGEADATRLPLPDRLHPDTATHQLMGERFADRAFGPGGVFAGVPGVSV